MLTEEEVLVQAGFKIKQPEGTQPPAPGAPPVAATPAPAVQTPAPIPAAGALPAPAGQQQNSSGEPPAAGSTTPLPNEEESKFLSGMLGGRFKSVAEIEEKLNSLAKLENEHKELIEKSSKSPFYDEYNKNLNDFMAKGGKREIFDTVQRIDTSDKADPKEVLSLRLQIQRKLSKEDAEFLVMRKYRLEEDAKDTDPDVREARLMMNIDYQDAIADLNEYKVEAMTLPEKPDPEKAVALRMDTWKPHIPKVVEQFKLIDIPIGDKVYQYEPDAEMQTHLAKYLQEVLANPYYESVADEKGMAEAKAIVGREFLAKEFPKIIAKLVADVKGDATYSFLKEKYNPGGQKQAPPPVPVIEDRDVRLAKQMDSRYK